MPNPQPQAAPSQRRPPALAGADALSLDTESSLAERYFQFLGTQYMTDAGTPKQRAKTRFITHLQETHLLRNPRFDLTACLAGAQNGFSGRVWFWSDQHLFNSKVIEYCARPFATATEMTDALLANCLAKVAPQDILVFGGDITMGKLSDTNELLRAIPCYKINVLGNHDTHKDSRHALAVDETVACLEFDFKGQSFFVSHYPLHEDMLAPNQINLHGHIHNKRLPTDLGSGQWHRNMCVEMTQYAPALLTELLAQRPGGAPCDNS